jgi:hypothetical protein
MRGYWSPPGSVTLPGVPSVRIGPNDVVRFAPRTLRPVLTRLGATWRGCFRGRGVLFMVGRPFRRHRVGNLFLLKHRKRCSCSDVVGRSLVEIFVSGRGRRAVWFMIGYPCSRRDSGIPAAVSGVIAGRAGNSGRGVTAQEAARMTTLHGACKPDSRPGR